MRHPRSPSAYRGHGLLVAGLSVLEQLVPGPGALSDLDDHEDVEDGGEEEGQDGPEERHADHHPALQPLPGEPPGVGEEGCEDPDDETCEEDLLDGGRPRPGVLVVPHRPRDGHPPVQRDQEDVQDDAHLEDVGEVLDVPVVRVDVGHHRAVLEDQNLDVKPGDAQQEVGQGEAGDAEVGDGVEVSHGRRHHHHEDVAEDDEDQQDGLQDEMSHRDGEHP